MKNFLSIIEIRHKRKNTIMLNNFKEIYKLPFKLLPGTEIWQILNDKKIKLTTILK